MWLLHIVFVAGLEDATLALLIVEKTQFYLDIHWILELFDSLLHCAEVACEVVLGLLLDKGKNNCQLIKEIVDRVQNWMKRKVRIS